MHATTIPVECLLLLLPTERKKMKDERREAMRRRKKRTERRRRGNARKHKVVSEFQGKRSDPALLKVLSKYAQTIQSLLEYIDTPIRVYRYE